MATGDVIFHNKFLAELMKGNIDLESGTVRCYLYDGAAPNIDSDHYWSDLSADEIALSGYTVATITTKTVTENDTNDRGEWDFDNPTWASIAAGTVTYAVLVLWTGNAATSTIICTIEADDANGQSYTITIPATGLLHVQQAA
jgi:hypothetical protein